MEFNNTCLVVIEQIRNVVKLTAISVIFTVTAGSLNPAYAAVNKEPKKHALLIDIQSYAHLKDRDNITGSGGLRRTLISEGFDVRFIRDGTRREVNQSINELVYRVKGSDVVLIVINAGIATTDRSEDVYILFHDTRIEDIEFDGLSLRGLDAALDQLKTPNQLLALTLDTLGTVVNQSSGGTRKALLKPTRDELQNLVAEQLSQIGKDRAVLSEIDSRDDKTLDQVSLAVLLANGIRGRADANKDSVVETRELEIFVQRQSKHAQVIQGYQAQPALQSSKLIRIAPADDSGAIPKRSMKIASRSLKKAVLTDDAASRHKEVLADWVVDGLLSRADNLRLYSLMSALNGKSKDQVPSECYQYYKSIEPTLEDAYLLQKSTKRNQLDNLVVAEKIKKQLGALPKSCLRK